MGTYVDPGNQAFAEVAGKNYLDRTGLIRMINESIGTENKLTCFSRPRRFGKSWIANMLSAYPNGDFRLSGILWRHQL